ncbi:hypothetical protein LXA43DRAFT_1091780 [Ganoderma leucocontextum]|nr:hypothetical protein LXA43DRAFT_1097383 [Ganoderma leucocontextum]KAI1794730.1 hypothetical protein LXA43DRAFT_1091780 [Ganoderma leucocontextum]
MSQESRCSECQKKAAAKLCPRRRRCACCVNDPSPDGCTYVYHKKQAAHQTSAVASASTSSSSTSPGSGSATSESASVSTTPPSVGSKSSAPAATADPRANSSLYADPLHNLWTLNNAVGAARQRILDEESVASAAVKGKVRAEWDMVKRKTVDFQVWVEPTSSPFDVSKYISTHPLLTLSAVPAVLEHFPPDTKVVVFYIKGKGKWQEREVDHPIALQEGEHSLGLKRPSAATLAPPPTKRMKAVNLAHLQAPDIATAEQSPAPSPSSAWPSPAPSNPPSSSSLPVGGRMQQSYTGVLGAPTFAPRPAAQRSFPSKFSCAEVDRFVNEVVAADNGIGCSPTNLRDIKLDLRRGDHELWFFLLKASSTPEGSFSVYRKEFTFTYPLAQDMSTPRTPDVDSPMSNVGGPELTSEPGASYPQLSSDSGSHPLYPWGVWGFNDGVSYDNPSLPAQGASMSSDPSVWPLVGMSGDDPLLSVGMPPTDPSCFIGMPSNDPSPPVGMFFNTSSPSSEDLSPPVGMPFGDLSPVVGMSDDNSSLPVAAGMSDDNLSLPIAIHTSPDDSNDDQSHPSPAVDTSLPNHIYLL